MIKLKTYCEQLGIKVGDLLRVIDEEAYWSVGSIVELIIDDASDAPKFRLVQGAQQEMVEEMWEEVSYMQKINPIPDKFEGYSKVEHPDGRVEFIPVPSKPDNYIDWNPLEADFSFVHTITGDQRAFKGEDHLEELANYFKLYPTLSLSSKAGKLQRRSSAIILACLLVDPDYEPDWLDDTERKYNPKYHQDGDEWVGDYWYTNNGSPAVVSSYAKVEQVCDLLTKWGVK